MKVSAWLGIIAISTGLCSLVACSDDDEESGTGGTGGSGATGGSSGSSGAAGSTAGAAGSTGGAAGSSGAAGAGGGAGATACDEGIDDCSDCLDACCEAEQVACADDTDCAAIYNCYAVNCTVDDAGTSCADDCVAANPTGAAKFGALMACGLTSCATQCT
jgi:hypothetical protein